MNSSCISYLWLCNKYPHPQTGIYMISIYAVTVSVEQKSGHCLSWLSPTLCLLQTSCSLTSVSPKHPSVGGCSLLLTRFDFSQTPWIPCHMGLYKRQHTIKQITSFCVSRWARRQEKTSKEEAAVLQNWVLEGVPCTCSEAVSESSWCSMGLHKVRIPGCMVMS